MTVKPTGIDAELDRLKQRVTELAAFCEQLKEENRSLKATLNEWTTERTLLAEKTAIAKKRVEAMIGRLKSMGQES